MKFDQFAAAVEREVERARGIHPGNALLALAFAEESGEVVKAVLDEPWAAVVKEAVQAASTAYRLISEGDASVVAKRERKGLDVVDAACPAKLDPVRQTVEGLVAAFGIEALQRSFADAERFRALFDAFSAEGDDTPFLRALKAGDEPTTLEEFRQLIDTARSAT